MPPTASETNLQLLDQNLTTFLPDLNTFPLTHASTLTLGAGSWGAVTLGVMGGGGEEKKGNEVIQIRV